jgi:hypothetical protein
MIVKTTTNKTPLGIELPNLHIFGVINTGSSILPYSVQKVSLPMGSGSARDRETFKEKK